MGTFLQRTLFVLLALLAARGDGLRAQWQIVAPNLVQTERQRVGAIRFRDGVAWVGTEPLCYSTDTGNTWKVSSFYQVGVQNISDIAIYDSLHICIGRVSDGIYFTSDGGQTWDYFNPSQSYPNISPTYTQVAYNGSAANIQALEYDTSIFYATSNGGASWYGGRTTNTGSTGALCFAISPDKTIYVHSYAGTEGWINKSTDLGQTWSGDSSPSDGDCETLAADSCDEQRLYLVNENTRDRSSGRSNLDLTTDAGATWQTMVSHPLDYFNGSFGSTADVLFVGTVPSVGNGVGIERSTDFGKTWQNVGGPNEEFDTRSIAVVNDNIVLVLDSAGNVWRTLNGGGYPVHPFFESPDTLFQMDTVRCDSITRSTVFTRLGCVPPMAITAKIVGQDSSSFTVSSFSADSIQVTLHGSKQGDKHALMILSIDNGTTDTITLAGIVNIPPDNLTLSTSELFRTDSISCDSITRTLVYSNGGCSSLSVSSGSIIGEDSASFEANNFSTDSISVTLYGVKQGNQHALLLLNLNNGSIDTVSLAGYVNLIPSTLTPSPSQPKTSKPIPSAGPFPFPSSFPVSISRRMSTLYCITIRCCNIKVRSMRRIISWIFPASSGRDVWS
jgi:photosystem II stability/assembly factor-like uncharacterized protein